MTKSSPVRWAFCGLLLALLPKFGAADNLMIAAQLNLNMPPFSWIDPCTGVEEGYGTRRMQRLAKDLGYKLQRVNTDLSESQQRQQVTQSVRQGEIDGYAALPRGIEPDIFIYGNQPFMTLQWAIFYPADADWHYQNWQSLMGKKGLFVNPSKSRIFTDKFHRFAEKALDRETTRSYEQSLIALEKRQVDYVLAYKQVGAAFLESKGLQSLYLAAPIEGVTKPVYLAVSRYSQVSERLNEIDSLLSRYETSGLNNLMMTASLRRWLHDNQQGCGPSDKG